MVENATLLSPVSRFHRMPFGASILPDGTVHFRLWAPSAHTVALVLAGSAEDLPMATAGNGFYECITAKAGAGSRYQYRINNQLLVPDPASRYQPDDVHAPSCVLDPASFPWQDSEWKGRPWEEAVLYELHVGTFTPEGTYAAIKGKLDHLAQLGITAIELMPVADFPGHHNWGYDGVLPYAPDSSYGPPDALKDLIQTAHAKGLMVFLDVVYNHFGPDGNYLHTYAEGFFTQRHHTPWGAAINFDDTGSEAVRAFIIHNALYWLEEYHFDGLRLDAVHAIRDESRPDILETLAKAVHTGLGQSRHIHLILENDNNQAKYLQQSRTGQPQSYTAQWNDDIHHALHVLTSGETTGYYTDYADAPADHLGRSLTQGFSYQGQASTYRNDEPRGETSQYLPPSAFIAFLQNHDQVGNRAFGDRLSAYANLEKIKVALAVMLLSPQSPLLFMGEEWAASEPFPFFCDFGPDLAQKVTAGRRKEFAKFPEFSNPRQQGHIPDPSSNATFRSAILNWKALEEPQHQEWLSLYKRLLTLRRKVIIPLLRPAPSLPLAEYLCLSDNALMVTWQFGSEDKLILFANFGDVPVTCHSINGQLLYETTDGDLNSLVTGKLPANSALWMRSGL